MMLRGRCVRVGQLMIGGLIVWLVGCDRPVAGPFEPKTRTTIKSRAGSMRYDAKTGPVDQLTEYGRTEDSVQGSFSYQMHADDDGWSAELQNERGQREHQEGDYSVGHFDPHGPKL